MNMLITMLLNTALILMLAACGSGDGTPDPAPSLESSSSPSSSSSSSSESTSSSSSSLASSSDGIPSYNTQPLAPDATGMDRNAADIAGEIRIGLNIGNTLEAYGGHSETYWGNPEITEAFVAFTKETGFNAIRLPVSWDQYADPDTAEIDADWLARVKEVVQYCVDNDLFVIVNIHWDGGWLEENNTPEKQAENNEKQQAYWEQIATLLREFDDRVLFASANEPNVENAEQMEVLLSYHQTFVDAVRATGGKNAYRVLVVQGPSTDTAHNPTWGEEDYVDSTFALMKNQFAENGIPIILGEYGTGVRDHLEGDDLQLHLDGRAYYFRYLTQQALANGMVPFFWDTGGLLDRHNNAVLDEQALEALMEGAEANPSYWESPE